MIGMPSYIALNFVEKRLGEKHDRNAEQRCACHTAAATGPLLHTYSALKSHYRKSFINNRPNPIEKRLG